MKKNMTCLFLILLTTLLLTPTILAADSQDYKWNYKSTLSEEKSGVALVSLNNKIYSIGGLKDNATVKTVEVYDPISDSWTKKKDLNIARHRASATTLNGKIYVTGGTTDYNTSVTNTVEIYDPENDEWTMGKQLPKNITGHASESYNGKLIVVGGMNYFTNASDEVYEFDPTLNEWSLQSKLNVARRYIDSSIINGKIYVAGGINNDGLLNSLEEYNIETKKWTLKKEMPSKVWGAPLVTLDDQLYVIGGYTLNASVSGNSTSLVNKYDPITDTWSKSSAMNTSRGMISAITLGNSIYVAGGSDGSKYHNVFEKYETNSTIPDPEPEPQPSGDRAILTVTMTTGLEKEFDLSMSEVNDFINWYDAKENGSGPARYGINKHNNNKGPFSKRIDYVIFKNILSFEVDEYTN